MVAEGMRWINDGVYALFGAEGLVAFARHTMLYLSIASALLVGMFLILLYWANARLHRTVHAWGRTLGLVRHRPGLRCLILARRIRQGGRRLSRTVRHVVADRAERRSLVALLRHFAREDLEVVLDQARSLITLADDRHAHALQELLERQTADWGAASSQSRRDQLQMDIAGTRSRLAKVSGVIAERDTLLQGLEEAAAAIGDLERELGALHMARSGSLPRFSDRIYRLVRDLRDLKEAHLELDAPKPPGA